MLKSGLYFWLSGAPKMTQMTVFQSLGMWWRLGRMHHKLAQSVGHGRLLNLLFGSSQTIGCRDMVISSFGVGW
jgi:hypothetical protein